MLFRSLYGGFEGTIDDEQLIERDLIKNVTTIEQTNPAWPTIWYEVVQGGNVNVIDGVTINASAPRQGSAIRMVASPCIFSKCRIENSYVPNSTLIFLETNMKMEAAFINCVISNNSCLQIFHTIYDISLINSVIADNNTDILFNVSNHHNEDINVFNSIIWGNNDIQSENHYPATFGNSIVQDFFTLPYAKDQGGNMDKDPDFSYDPVNPYYPLPYSIAVSSGLYNYIAPYNGFNDKDILNQYRQNCNKIDIGAYQYSCCSVDPKQGKKPTKQNTKDSKELEFNNNFASTYYSNYSKQLFLSINMSDCTRIQLFSMTGSLVYDSSCENGTSVQSVNLAAGVYICNIVNSKNEVVYSEKLISK